MLQIHPSRFPHQASLSLVEAMKESLRQGKRAYYVVPSQFTVEAELFLFRQLDTEILFQAQVKSFASLEREILAAGQAAPEGQLTEVGRRMLLRLLLDQDGSRWPALSAGSQREGFVQGLLDQLKEFKEYDLTPDSLRQIADDHPEASGLREKFLALAEIYADYQDRTQGRFADSDDQFQSAFAQLDQLDLFSQVDFYFDAFNSFSHMEAQALAALLRQGSQVHIALTLEPSLARLVLQSPDTPLSALEPAMDRLLPDAQAFAFSARFLQQLAALPPGSPGALRLVTDGTTTSALEPSAAGAGPAGRPGSSAAGRAAEAARGAGATSKRSSQGGPCPALAHVAQETFSYQPEKQATGPHLALRRYRNTEAEIEGTILDIKERMIRQGARLRDCQIILGDEEEYGDLLKSKLDQEGLSYFMDQLRSIDYHPLLQGVQASLDCLVRGYRAKDVLRLLKTGLFRLDPQDLELYQGFVERRRIQGTMFFDDRYFTLDEDFAARYPHKRDQWAHEYAAAARVNQVFRGAMADLRQVFRRESTGQEKTQALVNFLLQDPIQEGLAAYEADLEATGRLDKLEEHQQVWQALMDLFDELYLLLDESAMTPQAYAEVVKEGLRGISLGIIPPYQDSLLVSSLTRSRSLGRPYVWILGMAGDYLPSSGKGSSLLSDQELDLMRLAGYYLPSMRTFQQEEERLNFYSALAQAGESLTLSTALKSQANQELEVSYWLRQVEATSSDARLEDRLTFPFRSMAFSHGLTERLLPQALRSQDPSLVQRSQDYLRVMAGEPAWAESAQRIQAALTYTNERADLPEDLRQFYILSQQETSISQLEAYAACPYRYFVQYILRPDEPLTLAMDRRDLGSLIHGGLDAWARRMGDLLKDPQTLDPDQSLACLEAAYQEESQQVLDQIQRTFPDNQLLLFMAGKTLKENHNQLLTQIQTGALQEMRTELAFGDHGALPGLPLLSGAHSLTLAGRIDRLDLFKDGRGRSLVQLVDYKTGAKSLDMTRLAAGLDLQLPLYTLAASQALQASPLGFFYFHVLPEEARTLDQPGQLAAESSDQGKLDGILLSDPEAWQVCDPALVEEGRSTVYSLKGRKRALADKDNLLPPEAMDQLLTHSYQEAQAYAGLRAQGKISPHPFRQESGKGIQTACQYCAYGAICRFDRQWQFKDYRMIPKADKQEKEGGHGIF